MNDEKRFEAQLPIGFHTSSRIAEIKKEEKKRKAEKRKNARDAKKEKEVNDILDQEWDPKSGMSEALFNTKVQIAFLRKSFEAGIAEPDAPNLAKLQYLSQVEGALSMVDASEYQIDVE